MADFYQLVGWEPADAEDLRLAKAAPLLKAVQDNRDFRLLACHQRGADAGALTVEVTCSGVPNRNSVGILTRERIAILVFANDLLLPTVRMLRMDFPHVMHINGTEPNEPREPCLYFEPTRAVMRTWTAPQFLRRIQWWLASTANDVLHVADQPLELPFFNSGWELVLPAGFEALRSNPKQRFHLQAIGPARRNEARTVRVLPAQGESQGTWGLALFRCNPLVHGRTINVPNTLGSLASELGTRGVDFVTQLRTQLIEDLSGTGEKLATDGNRFAVLVELPIVRDLGGIVERVQRIAFLLLAGKLDLGLRVGAYIKHEGTVYRFQEIPGGNAMQELDWQSLPIMPVAVLDAAEPARLREYSGIKGDGPAAGVLVGAGALGSALVDLWSRGGWGSWTVVDSDHIKPHNLARHRAYDGFVGESKATFARVISETIAPPGVVCQALTCDACDTKNDELTKAFGAADFVLDCSTTLDFPRLASTATTKARHASAFLTPSGRDCVLLMEDTQRKLRLNTLEAQYYRALISRPWGNDHLKGNLSTFWSGASCRDVSVKLEYASILAHAAVINQQVRALLESEEACVRIWARDPATGRVDTHRVPVYKPVEHHSQAMTLRYDEGLVRRLRAMRQQYLPKETGGVVVGYFDLNLRELVLVDCFPPPLDSTHSTTHFVRGVQGVLESVTQAQKRTAGVVGYVGEWHSHPPGHSALPSRDDFIQLHKLSNDMAQDGLPILQVIVGEHDISLQVLGEVLR